MLGECFFQPADDAISGFRFAFSDAHGEMIKLIVTYIQPLPVLVEKEEQGHDGYSFVAILEGMIFDHHIEQDSSLSREALIEVFSVESLERGMEATFQDIREAGVEGGDRFISCHKLNRQAMGGILNLVN